jgi:hypothetical protein
MIPCWKLIFNGKRDERRENGIKNSFSSLLKSIKKLQKGMSHKRRSHRLGDRFDMGAVGEKIELDF